MPMAQPAESRMKPRRDFQLFGKSSHGFLTNEAVMIAVETRTSAPYSGYFSTQNEFNKLIIITAISAKIAFFIVT